MGHLIECPTTQLLDEPDFDAVGDWVLDIHAAIAGGQLIFDWPIPVARPIAIQNIPMIKNQIYLIEIKVDFVATAAGGGVRIRIGTHPNQTSTLIYTAPGTYQYLLLAEDDTGVFRVSGVNYTEPGIVKVDYINCWNYAEDVMCRYGFLEMGLTFGNMWLLDENRAMFQLVNEATGTNITFIAEV